MLLEEAIEYAKEHIHEIPTGKLEYISDSDEIDDEDLEFMSHSLFFKDIDYWKIKGSMII